MQTGFTTYNFVCPVKQASVYFWRIAGGPNVKDITNNKVIKSLTNLGGGGIFAMRDVKKFMQIPFTFFYICRLNHKTKPFHIQLPSNSITN